MAGIEKEHPGMFDMQTRVIVLIVSSFASFLVPFMHCVKLAFAIFSVLCFSGIFTSFARGRVR